METNKEFVVMTREDIEECFSYHAAGAALEYYEQEYL